MNILFVETMVLFFLELGEVDTMSTDKKADSLLKSTFWAILPAIVVAIVLFLVDRSSLELNVREKDNVATNFMGLFPERFFSETFAPYELPLFNLILGLVIAFTIIVVVWQVIARAISNR